MNYSNVVPARFIERENRFVARVSLQDADEVRVHVKNTGRCRELLIPGAAVYLESHAESMGRRKYRYDLIAVEKVRQGRTILINMDSQAPNRVVEEALKSGRLYLPKGSNVATKSVRSQQGMYDIIRPETAFGTSRFDFYLESHSSLLIHGRRGQSPAPQSSVDSTLRRTFIEVKGVTLEEDGIARFPDAPTERGVKHIRELERALEEGYEAYIIFVIQMKGVDRFEPNDVTHPEFGEALRHAGEVGVNIIAFDCKATPEALTLDQPVPVIL